MPRLNKRDADMSPVLRPSICVLQSASLDQCSPTCVPQLVSSDLRSPCILLILMYILRPLFSDLHLSPASSVLHPQSCIYCLTSSVLHPLSYILNSASSVLHPLPLTSSAFSILCLLHPMIAYNSIHIKIYMKIKNILTIE